MDPISSSSSSTSLCRTKNYDVFLSFRGIDTRSNIISHLYVALDQKGIHTFKDNEKLQLGHSRSDLFDAIQGSHIAIVTFSENYARSKWCLDELQKVMELKEEGKLTVIPIFYHVSPREVRLHTKDSWEKGCYQKAMDEIEARYGKDSEMVKRWRSALRQGGDLIGIHVVKGQDEADVVREVVGKALQILDRRVHLEVAKYPVGIYRHLEAIRRLLHIDPQVNDVCMLGLLGLGGVGKTTLSKAICNDIADSFDSWCFLPNVRATTSRVFNGLALLQQTLLRRLLREDGLTVLSVDEGKRLIMERLQNKKVLVILDDVNESNQLDALAGNLNWFGNGSRIIITTRNNHVFSSVHVHHVYNIELLNQKEAIDLFRLHAFGEKQEEVNVDHGLIDSFIKYAGGLPLALVVLGAFLRGRSATEWKGKLKELKESADETINSVLKISFDGLEKRHKEIFLDVACFFKGWKVDYVKKILDSCDLATSLGISILVERCLVTVVDGEIQMHDLLGAMGESIARDECSNGGNRIPTRIWRYEDFREVLLEDRERQDAVKGIVLIFSQGKNFATPIESNDFKGFRNLRILIVWNVDVVCLEKSLQLPRGLRWFQWQGCPVHNVEFDPHSKLVGLDLHYSKTREIKGETGFEDLKYVNLSWCTSLVNVPDLSKSLKLEYLDLNDCFEFEKFSCSLGSKNLRTLSFVCCLKLHRLPDMMEELTLLETLDLSFTAVKKLPDSFGNLVSLKELDLSSCKELTTIPSSIYRLRALKKLSMSDCIKLSGFPQRPAGAATDILGFPNFESLLIRNCKLKDLEFLNDLSCFQTLRSLNLSYNDFDHIPTCISKFKKLQNLNLSYCRKLVEISELPNVSELFVAGCGSLKTLPSLHTFICQSTKEYKVDLFNCLGLDKSFVDRSLPLEKVREFVGKADVLFPGEMFPHWVNFQSMECCCASRYRVSVPGNIYEDEVDIFGLAMFVSFDCFRPRPEEPVRLYCTRMMAEGSEETVCYTFSIAYWMNWEHGEEGGIRTWFMYFPLEPVLWKRGLRLEFLNIKMVRRWGMHLFYKRQEDDHRVEVQVQVQVHVEECE